MHLTILTLYPAMFPGPLGEGLMGKALAKGLWRLTVINMRDFATDAHASVDDTAFGGGSGMVLMAPVVDRALQHATQELEHPQLVYVSARGTPITQARVQTWAGQGSTAQTPPLVLLCGRFEGVDQRVIDHWGMDEITVGDMVLMGGEVAAMALAESVVRLLPSVLGNPDSVKEESFEDHLLGYPQFTRPRVWQGHEVPPVLLSGHHGDIQAWRQQQRCAATQARRPDLWQKAAAFAKKDDAKKLGKKGEGRWTLGRECGRDGEDE